MLNCKMLLNVSQLECILKYCNYTHNKFCSVLFACLNIEGLENLKFFFYYYFHVIVYLFFPQIFPCILKCCLIELTSEKWTVQCLDKVGLLKPTYVLTFFQIQSPKWHKNWYTNPFFFFFFITIFDGEELSCMIKLFLVNIV